MNNKTKLIDIIAPSETGHFPESWKAEYRIIGEGNARIVQIESLSSITVVVSRVLVDWYGLLDMPPYFSYYIAVPNFNMATEGFETLALADNTASNLIARGMPWLDALTVAQVLCHSARLLEE